MKNLTARFTSTDSTLILFARTGKKGINVAARVRTNGEKAAVGCRNLFAAADEAQAVAKFDELRADAIAKGWAEKAKTKPSTFSTIPEAPGGKSPLKKK